MSDYTLDALQNDLVISQRQFYYWGMNHAYLEADGVLVYPNPVHELLYLESDLDYLETIVLDLSGKCLLITHSRNIDLGFLRSGIYLIRIKGQDGKQIKTAKILKLQ